MRENFQGESKVKVLWRLPFLALVFVSCSPETAAEVSSQNWQDRSNETCSSSIAFPLKSDDPNKDINPTGVCLAGNKRQGNSGPHKTHWCRCRNNEKGEYYVKGYGYLNNVSSLNFDSTEINQKGVVQKTDPQSDNQPGDQANSCEGRDRHPVRQFVDGVLTDYGCWVISSRK